VRSYIGQVNTPDVGHSARNNVASLAILLAMRLASTGIRFCLAPIDVSERLAVSIPYLKLRWSTANLIVRSAKFPMQNQQTLSDCSGRLNSQLSPSSP
jgi:hypothetical protein